MTDPQHILWLCDRVQAQHAPIWPDNPVDLEHKLTCRDRDHCGCHLIALVESTRELSALLIAQAAHLQDLEQLATAWREKAEAHAKHGDCYRIGQGWGLAECAEALEATLARKGREQ